MMDFDAIRDLFPITKVKINGKGIEKNLIYFDHAASTHAPQPVLDMFLQMMKEQYANVHRGEHHLSCLSTEMFEKVPQKIASFLGETKLDNSGSQIIMTSNTTSSLDLASHIFGEVEGDVLSTVMEHHSNDLPHRKRGKYHHAQLLENGTLDLDDLENTLQRQNIKLVAVTAASNVTGFMPPVHKIARMAHNAGAKILVDAAQRLAHHKIDVKALDHPEHLDFLAGAGHKTYSPFGASFLFGNTEDMNQAEPYIAAGGTVELVTPYRVVFLKGPERHMFGTPNIAGSIALGESIEFLQKIGMEKIRRHELDILKYLMKGLDGMENVQTYGDIPLDQKLAVVPFNVRDKDHGEVSNELNRFGGVATRNGCFCAQPYVAELLYGHSGDITNPWGNTDPNERAGAVRASLGIYNNQSEVDVFLETLEKISS